MVILREGFFYPPPNANDKIPFLANLSIPQFFAITMTSLDDHAHVSQYTKGALM